MSMKIPIYFNPIQFKHNPIYEWAFGEKLSHPETSKRAENIVSALEKSPEFFTFIIPDAINPNYINKVHSKELTKLYKTAQESLESGQIFYPSVFPRRDVTKGNPRSIKHAGYFSFDSGTPLTSVTIEAAQWSVACAHQAFLCVKNKQSKIAYALCRPPGHHAGRSLFGGYCYYNNAAIIAKRICHKAKVAIVDIDFHHGNGTQDIFYQDNQVFFISVHGDPNEFYPYYTGHSNERGIGKGEGFNLNLPLPKGCDGQEYLKVLDQIVIPNLKKFQPEFLIISAGFDTYKDDPLGAFLLDTYDYAEIGARFKSLNLPTVVLQEGGYFVDKLGENVATFLQGMK